MMIVEQYLPGPSLLQQETEGSGLHEEVLGRDLYQPQSEWPFEKRPSVMVSRLGTVASIILYTFVRKAGDLDWTHF